MLIKWQRRESISCHPVLGKRNSLCLHQGGCFTNASRALQNNLTKIYNARNHIRGENFKLKLCACTKSYVRFLQCTNFERISWRNRETLVKQPPADPYMLRWMINKVDPKLRCISRAKSLIKSCDSHKYVAFNELTCHIVTIKGLLLIFSDFDGPSVTTVYDQRYVSLDIDSPPRLSLTWLRWRNLIPKPMVIAK